MPMAVWTEQCMMCGAWCKPGDCWWGSFDHCRCSGSGFVVIIQIEPCFFEADLKVLILPGSGFYWTLVGEMSATDKPMAQSCMWPTQNTLSRPVSVLKTLHSLWW